MATAVSTAEVKTKYGTARTALTEIAAAGSPFSVVTPKSSNSYGDGASWEDVQKACRAALDTLNSVEPIVARLP